MAFVAHPRVRFALVAISCALGLACSAQGDAAPRVSLGATTPPGARGDVTGLSPSGKSDLPPLARAALDSGNAQLRSKRYDAALASYRAAVREAPGHVAPEFGIYMVAKRQGNNVLADSALRIINAHTGGSATWTDSAMQSAHGGRALPPSHPSL